MKLLVSPTSVAEARSILDAPIDVIDVKNAREGSLGAQQPAVAKEIAELAHAEGRLVSMAIGDLHHQPGTAAMAAYAAAALGADFVKAGLLGSKTLPQAIQTLGAMVDAVRMTSSDAAIVACGYADFRNLDGLSPQDLVTAAKHANCDYAMLDTFVKDGKSLFQHLSRNEVQEFVEMAHAHELQVALAGSIKPSDLPMLARLLPDLIGVRGAICENLDRESVISPKLTNEFARAVASSVPF